jgi:F-type H+-transporting ATPase subunit delta
LAQSANLVSGVAERYASALFELALSEKKLPAVEKDLNAFGKMLDGSEDLLRLMRSPVFSADDQSKAIGSILDKAKIAGLFGNFLRVVAGNRRLFVVPGILRSFNDMMVAHRGEVTADVTLAQALSAKQTKELKAALKSVVGKDVAINATIDPSILGGMIVKIGSRQIDTTLKTKLSSLKTALKEVG